MRAIRSSKISGAENGPGMRGPGRYAGPGRCTGLGRGQGAWADTADAHGLVRYARPGPERRAWADTHGLARYAGPRLIRAAWAVQGAWDAHGLGRCAGPGRSKRPVRYGRTRSKRPCRCARPGRGNVQEALSVRTAWAGQGGLSDTADPRGLADAHCLGGGPRGLGRYARPGRSKRPVGYGRSKRPGPGPVPHGRGGWSPSTRITAAPLFSEAKFFSEAKKAKGLGCSIFGSPARI